MALSTYFNWDTLQTPNSEIISTNFHEPTPELAPDHHYQHLFPYSDESFFLPNNFFDPYFDPTSFLYPEIYPPSLFSCTSSYDPLISLTDIFPTEDYNNLLPCPKRQKLCCHEEQELKHSSLQEIMPPNSFDGFVPNPCSLPSDDRELVELFSGVPEFKVPQLPPPQVTCVGSADNNLNLQCEKKANERTISAQSVAARERRRKITEKTQELGKLVPGGPMMNTAEMLHAAAKYVKYLQAQVGMLELMKTLKEDEAPPPTDELHALVASPLVQEKLYSEEMCFVPKEFVTTLTNHADVGSRPDILKGLEQLIGTNIEKKGKQE